MHREQRRLGLNKRSEEPLAGSACVAHGGRQGTLSVGWRPARSDREESRSAPSRPQGPPGQGLPNGAGELRVPSVTPEPARWLDAFQFGKIKGAYLLQLACGRGLPETVGQVVEPCLILILEVEQSAYRILPALRSRAAVLRPAVMQARLLCLAALSITPLSLGVGQSHVHCAPLRNGADGAAAVWSAVSTSAAAARWRERLLSMAVRRR